MFVVNRAVGDMTCTPPGPVFKVLKYCTAEREVGGEVAMPILWYGWKRLVESFSKAYRLFFACSLHVLF